MVSKNLNHYLIYIILCLLVNRAINGQFIPRPRIGHQAVLVNNKIYYIGGTNSNNTDDTENDIFYLDNPTELSSTGSLSWVKLDVQGEKLPLTRRHISNVGGSNQDLIFIIGGRQSDRTKLVYEFDTKTNVLSVPEIQGNFPPRRENANSVSYEGKIYIFSGRLQVANSDQNLFFNNFDILNTVTMNWEVGNSTNAPLPEFMYTATLVNGIIYYIGGFQKSGTYVRMNNIYQYDTASSTWSLKSATATGNMPGPRKAHSAVSFNGKICIFGGKYRNFNMPQFLPPVEPIAVLDTTSLVWSTPQFENINTPKLEDNSIPTLAYHTATLLQNNFMVIAFGNFTNSQGINNDVYVFDLGKPKFQWFKLENPKSPTTPGNSPGQNDPKDPHRLRTIGLSIGIALIVVVIVIASLLIHRCIKKNRECRPVVIETPGDNYYMSQRSPVNNKIIT